MSVEIFKIAKNTQLRKICIKFYWNDAKMGWIEFKDI